MSELYRYKNGMLLPLAETDSVVCVSADRNLPHQQMLRTLALGVISTASPKPFKDVVNEPLRRGLITAQALPEAKPYSVPSYSMGAVMGATDLDKALAVAERLEDEGLARELARNA